MLLASLATLLRRTLGERVSVSIQQSDAPWYCYADRSQLENALLNLGINARDAMGERGGQLRLVARNLPACDLREPEAEELPDGDFVEICVIDDGSGMNEQTMARAFEPFFTTKEHGKSSGLGLSMVYGFARQSGGQATISSREGLGTEVRIVLPRASEGPAGPERRRPALELPMGRGQALLLVEDQPAVARMTSRMIERLGYRVAIARDGERALELLKNDASLELMLSDIGLPGPLDGIALTQEACRRRPRLRALLMSGYERSVDHSQSSNAPPLEVLRKPFRVADLAAALDRLSAKSSAIEPARGR